jgi:hypothetical protein
MQMGDAAAGPQREPGFVQCHCPNYIERRLQMSEAEGHELARQENR